MVQPTEIYRHGKEHLTPEEQHRAEMGDKICREISEDVGINMDSFHMLPAWLEFVEGEIDEIELWRKARVELKHCAAL